MDPNVHTVSFHKTPLLVAMILLVLAGVSIGYGLCQLINGLTGGAPLIGGAATSSAVATMLLARGQVKKPIT